MDRVGVGDEGAVLKDRVASVPPAASLPLTIPLSAHHIRHDYLHILSSWKGRLDSGGGHDPGILDHSNQLRGFYEPARRTPFQSAPELFHQISTPSSPVPLINGCPFWTPYRNTAFRQIYIL